MSHLYLRKAWLLEIYCKSISKCYMDGISNFKKKLPYATWSSVSTIPSLIYEFLYDDALGDQKTLKTYETTIHEIPMPVLTWRKCLIKNMYSLFRFSFNSTTFTWTHTLWKLIAFYHIFGYTQITFKTVFFFSTHLSSNFVRFFSWSYGVLFLLLSNIDRVRHWLKTDRLELFFKVASF